MSQKGFIGAGILRIGIQKADGTWGNDFEIGNTELFDVSADSDVKTLISYRDDGTFGQAFDTDVQAKPTQIKVTVTSVTAQILALAMAATLEDETIVAGTVTNELYTAMSAGDSFRLAHEDISALVVSNDTTNAVLDAGVDYTLTKNTITMLTGTSIDVSVGYAYGGINWKRLKGGTTSFTARLDIRGLNRRSQKKYRVFAGNVTLQSKKGFSFLSNDFQKLEIEGTANIDQDATSDGHGAPFVVWLEK